MRVQFGLVVLLVSLSLVAWPPARVVAGSQLSPLPATQIVRWSPLDATGYVKKSLHVEPVRGGGCGDIGYTYVGAIAYRCGAGHYLYNACWREGPGPTDSVVCASDPWSKTVWRLHSPHLLLYPGVTHDRARTDPWGIELADGTRCSVYQGAVSAVDVGKRRLTIRYGCAGWLELLEDVRRGRVWHVTEIRYDRALKRSVVIGDVAIRRVIFGTLPPPIARQNDLARRAVARATALMRRSTRRPHPEWVVWVRVTLPDLRWARVMFADPGSNRSWYAVLQRIGNRWTDASRFKPYCTKLPTKVREQLFLDSRTWNPPPDNILVPLGRCASGIGASVNKPSHSRR